MGVIHGAEEENQETEPEYGLGASGGPHTAEEKTENGGRPLAAVVARAVVARVTHGAVLTYWPLAAVVARARAARMTHGTVVTRARVARVACRARARSMATRFFPSQRPGAPYKDGVRQVLDMSHG